MAQAHPARKGPRTSVFVDGDYLDFATRHQLKIGVDYRQLANALRREFGTDAQLYLFRSLISKKQDQAQAVTSLEKAGFTVKSSPLLKGPSAKTNIDAVITADILVNAANYDRAIIVSGDSDFIPVLEALKSLRKQVIVAAMPFTSSRLRESANGFIDLHGFLKGTFTGLPPELAAQLDERTEALRSLYFAKGFRSEAYAEVCRLVGSANTRIWLADRYVTADVLRLLDSAKPGVGLRVWTEKARGDDFEPVVARIQTSGRQISVYYVGKEVHGRFLIIDKDVWHLGHSLKDLGSSDAVIQLLEDRQSVKELERRLHQLAGA